MSDMAINWLLEGNNPSVKYRTLTEPLGRNEDDDEAESVYQKVLVAKYIKKIFDI